MNPELEIIGLALGAYRRRRFDRFGELVAQLKPPSVAVLLRELKAQR